MIATVKAVAEGEKRPFYLIMYKWVDGKFANSIFLDTETPPSPQVVRTSGKTQAYLLKSTTCSRKVSRLIKFIPLSPERVQGLVDNRKLLMKRDSSNTTSANKPFTSEVGEMISF